MFPRPSGLALLLTLTACRTQPYDLAELQAIDFSQPAADMTTVDSGPCVTQPAADSGICPCGSQGLCRPATGRITAQVSSGGGLRVVVMDDNGCNLHDITTDHPFSPPRWAPDHERLAYVTDNGNVHVVRVDPYGNVACRTQTSVPGKPTEVAWSGANNLWLFTPGAPGSIVDWQLGKGTTTMVTVDAIDFDAGLSPGPLLVVDKSCGANCTSLKFRADVSSGTFFELTNKPTTIGPIRLSAAGDQAVYELEGLHLIPTSGTGTEVTFGQAGDHAPSFALDGQAILYTSNNDELHYHFINAPGAPDQVIPSSWQKIYGPAWSPLPAVCGLPPTCF